MSDPDPEALVRGRYGLKPDAPLPFPPVAEVAPGLAAILDRRVTRRYAPEPVPEALLRTVLAGAQSAPSKSDLQQYSIIVIQAPDKIARIADWIGGMDWIKQAPVFLLFCGDVRRGRRGVEDHHAQEQRGRGRNEAAGWPAAAERQRAQSWCAARFQRHARGAGHTG